MENLPHSGPSAFDIPREHGISAGAALCEGYAKFEFIQPTPEGVVRQVYKSFQCSHPGGSFKLVDILFVQALEHTYLQKFEDFPPQIDPNDLYLKEDLLAKIQANLQITKLEEALAEENIKEKVKKGAKDVIEEVKEHFESEEHFHKSDKNRRILGGIIVIAIGLIFLLNGFFPWVGWNKLWPVILIAAGIIIMIQAFKKKD